jgi:hypothetical protein
MPEDIEVLAEDYRTAISFADDSVRVMQLLSNQEDQYGPHSYFRDEGPVAEMDGYFEMLGRQLSDRAPIGDVVSAVKSLNRQFQVAVNLRLPIATMETSNGEIPVLIDNPETRGEILASRDPEYVRDHWFSTYRRIPGAGRFRNIGRAGDLLNDGFRAALTLFLAFRFTGKKILRHPRAFYSQNASGTPNPGAAAHGNNAFHIELDCSNQGLAAYASPAYAVTWQNLGSLTSPARGILPPGAWIFGADGSPLPSFTYDPRPVHIPNNFTPVTRCF